MNREERRRQARQRGDEARERWQREVPPDRREAEWQDFTAGTIFAAGAMGVLAESCPDPEHALNAFVIMLDPARTFGVEPRLRRLFEVAEGHPEAQIAGAVSWSAFGGPDPLVKLKLRLERPVRPGSSSC